jgi:hypothetical protein
VLATPEKRTVLADLPGHRIDRIHERSRPKWIRLDMELSEPDPGDQEGTAWNGHFGCSW